MMGMPKQAIYYLKLTFFLFLAGLGGFLGALVGLGIGYACATLLMVSVIIIDPFADPLGLWIWTILIAVPLGFCWGFYHSYNLLVRNYW
jgi:hypothetical protein